MYYDGKIIRLSTSAVVIDNSVCTYALVWNNSRATAKYSDASETNSDWKMLLKMVESQKTNAKFIRNKYLKRFFFLYVAVFLLVPQTPSNQSGTKNIFYLLFFIIFQTTLRRRLKYRSLYILTFNCLSPKRIHYPITR